MLSRPQKGVLAGMAAGMSLALLLVFGGWLANPLGYAEPVTLSARCVLVAHAALGPLACLAIGIGRLAKHRFFTPEDIDGGGLAPGSERAHLLQSLLQNTLEQSLLAIGVWLAWAFTMPATGLSVLPLAATVFVVGRALFFAGYGRGAPARSLGFTLTFYPSLLMLLILLTRLLIGS